MKIKKYLTLLGVALSTLATSLLAQTLASIDLAGRYTNRSESSFIYTLNLTKDGQATYREPDPEGGKSLTFKGKWTLADNVLIVDFGKIGRYTFLPHAKLSWESFGCKEASLGLEIKSTPKGKTTDSAYHVWRANDLKNADRCKRI
jgi:hypothetical protein